MLKKSFILRFCLILFACLLLASCSKREGWHGENSHASTSAATTEKSVNPESAQPATITKAQFDKLVDYVSWYYVSAYLKKKEEKERIIHHDKLCDSGIDIAHPLSVDSLSSRLAQSSSGMKNINADYKCYESAKTLADLFKRKKESFNDGPVDSAITRLTDLPHNIPPSSRGGFKVYLKDETEELKGILQERFPKQAPAPSAPKTETPPPPTVEEPTEVVKQVVVIKQDTTSRKGTSVDTLLIAPLAKSFDNADTLWVEIEKVTKGDKSHSSLSLWWLFLLIGAVGGVAVWTLLKKKMRTRKSSSSIDQQTNQIRLLQAEKSDIQRENSHLKNQLAALQRERDSLFNENIQLGEQLDAFKGTIQQSSQPAAQMSGGTAQHPSSNNVSVLYAESIVNGYFAKVKEQCGEDSVFELRLKNANTAEFVIWSNATGRVIANPSFADGCDKQVLPNASTIETTSVGIAQKDESTGKWMVSQNLKIVIK